MKNYQKCDRVSIFALTLSVFLGIMAFLPGSFMPSSVLKGYLVFGCVLVAFVAWLIGRLIEGAFHIPWTPVLAAGGIFLGTMFLSSLFSHTPYLAFFGESFEQGTFAVFGSMLIALFLASMLFTSSKRVGIFLKSFFILYIILAFFQLIHLIFPALTTLGIFYNRVDSPVGLWSDFAFLSGAALVGSMLMLQLTRPSKKTRILLIVAMVLGLFFVILTNIFMVWIVVGVSAILVLIYTLISNRFSEGRYFPFLAFFLSLIALLFILANSLFGGMLANLLGATYIDVHPSLSASVHTSLLSLQHNPVFGAGPNRFLREWLVYRPTAVNTNTLWDVPFTSGASLVMTIAVLGGALSIVAALLFLIAFAYESGKKVFVSTGDHTISGLPIFGLFMFALYFLLAIVFFSPGLPITLLALVFIGIFLGSLVGERRIAVREIHFLKDQRASFFSILIIVALLLVSAGGVYSATQRFGALVFFQRSLAAAQANNLDLANNRIGQAISLSDMPVFERTRTSFAEQSIQATLATSTSTTSSDAIKNALQNAISTGNTAARNAIAIDPTDPANYLALGDLLRLITPLKVEGVAAAGIDAYQHAITLAPNYPKSYLSLAELYYDSGDNQNARVYVQKALDQKANYTDAFFLLAQIEIADGNSATAMQRIQDATVVDPSNPDAFFELGFLRYNSGDYKNAITAFHTTINLNVQYLNAWYYLALADQKIGNDDEATAILQALHKRLPDNENINNALNPVSQTPVAPAPKDNTITPSPATSKGEKAKKLPLPSTAPASDTVPKTTQ